MRLGRYPSAGTVTMRCRTPVYALLAAAVSACNGEIGEPASSGNDSGEHTGNQATSDGSDESDANPTSDRGDGASTLPPPAMANADGTIMFVPSVVDASRNSVSCGTQAPPFANGDQFFLEITGNAAKSPSNQLVVSFNSPLNVVEGTPVKLTVLPYLPHGTKIYAPDGGYGLFADQNAEYQSSQSVTLNFSYTQGTNPNEIDNGAFDAVTLTLVAMPRMEGDPLTIRVQVHFADGRLLDETFSGALTTLPHGCPAVEPRAG